MTNEPPVRPSVSRRTALVGVLATAVAGVSTVAPAASAGAAQRSAGRSKARRHRWRDLGSAARVDLGDAELFRRPGWVVTHPSAGEYYAYSALCAHRRCARGMAQVRPRDVAGDPRIAVRKVRVRDGRLQIRS